MTKVRRTVNLSLKMAEDSQRAAAELLKQGLYLPDAPGDEGIPRLQDIDDLTSLSDEALMDVMSSMTAWAGYLSAQYALAVIDERCAEEVVAQAEALAIIREWGGASSDRVTIAKAQRTVDPDVIERKQDLLNKYAYRKLVEMQYQNVDREAAIVSRELTRRTSGADPKQRRTDRFTR